MQEAVRLFESLEHTVWVGVYYYEGERFGHLVSRVEITEVRLATTLRQLHLKGAWRSPASAKYSPKRSHTTPELHGVQLE
jgi:hypothetical protein